MLHHPAGLHSCRDKALKTGFRRYVYGGTTATRSCVGPKKLRGRSCDGHGGTFGSRVFPSAGFVIRRGRPAAALRAVDRKVGVFPPRFLKTEPGTSLGWRITASGGRRRRSVFQRDRPRRNIRLCLPAVGRLRLFRIVTFRALLVQRPTSVIGFPPSPLPGATRKVRASGPHHQGRRSRTAPRRVVGPRGWSQTQLALETE